MANGSQPDLLQQASLASDRRLFSTLIWPISAIFTVLTKERTMAWHQVFIRNNDVADVSAGALMNKFHGAYIAAGVPAGVTVFHGKTSQGDHVYYFSPQASLVAPELLAKFEATACASDPDVSNCRKVNL
jgi:hypothetical protein